MLNKIISNLNSRVLRIIIFAFFLFLIMALSRWITGMWIPKTEYEKLWLFSGLIMVLLSMFFIEPYYTAPTNVSANSITIILILISIKGLFTNNNMIFWWSGIIYSFILLSMSISSVVLRDIEKSPISLQNRISDFLKRFSLVFGTGNLHYS